MDILAVIFVLGIAGVLFSGYLSSHRLIKRTCAFNESCPNFLGKPACYFGFAMFTIIFLASGAGAFAFITDALALQISLWVAIAGILFAGSFTLGEMPRFLNPRTPYKLIFPTCAWGLLFYIAVAALAYYALGYPLPF